MLACIGGSGLYSFPGVEGIEKLSIDTPFGSADLQRGKLAGRDFVLLARHGKTHGVPPHKINYRANIYALKELGVSTVISTNAVGGIRQDCGPDSLILPDQVIDYTYGREHTFFDSFHGELSHIDFTEPFSPQLRASFEQVARSESVELVSGACYACTQGPRLETAAEVRRLERDGADIVGMTAMPEAALARELELSYVSLCLSVNWAPGITGPVTMDEIDRVLKRSISRVQALITSFVEQKL